MCKRSGVHCITIKKGAMTLEVVKGENEPGIEMIEEEDEGR